MIRIFGSHLPPSAANGYEYLAPGIGFSRRDLGI
jgi:hypothetical protein